MICNKCGNKLENGTRCCDKCGATIDTYGGIETFLTVISAIALVTGLSIGITDGGESWFLFWAAIWTIVFSAVCKRIGYGKGIYYGFIVGWLLGIIGLIVMAALPSEVPMVVSNNANKYDKYDCLEKLQKLKNSGAITEIEYEIEKAKILNS